MVFCGWAGSSHKVFWFLIQCSVQLMKWLSRMSEELTCYISFKNMITLTLCKFIWILPNHCPLWPTKWCEVCRVQHWLVGRITERVILVYQLGLYSYKQKKLGNLGQTRIVRHRGVHTESKLQWRSRPRRGHVRLALGSGSLLTIKSTPSPSDVQFVWILIFWKFCSFFPPCNTLLRFEFPRGWLQVT